MYKLSVYLNHNEVDSIKSSRRSVSNMNPIIMKLFSI